MREHRPSAMVLIADTETRMEYNSEVCFKCKGTGQVCKRWSPRKASTVCYQCDGVGRILKHRKTGEVRKMDHRGLPKYGASSEGHREP